MVRLDAAEPLQLFCLDADLLAKANLAYSAADERRPVRVQRFMEGSSARLSPHDRDASLRAGTSSRRLGLIVTVAEVLDHSSFHRELDQVEGNEPNDVLPKMRKDKSRKLIGDLPKPKRYQSNLPRSSECK